MDTSTAALDELLAPRNTLQETNSGSSRKIAKAIAWGAMLLLALYYVRSNVIPYLEVRPEIYDYLWPKRGWLWLHLSGGVLTLLLGWLQFRLWFGSGGQREVEALQQQVRQQAHDNAGLKQRTEALAAEVEDLKSGEAAVEERARSELGMIKPGETFYRVVEPQPQPVRADEADKDESR